METPDYFINLLLYFIVSGMLFSIVGFIGVCGASRSPAMVQHEFFIVVFMAATMYAQYYLFGWYI